MSQSDNQIIEEYLKDRLNNEIYSIRRGRHVVSDIYKSTTDESRIFARKSTGEPYYLKDKASNERYPKIDGNEVPIDENGYKLYAKKLNSEVYPKDKFGDEQALYDSNGKPIYARNQSGKEFYPRDQSNNENILGNIYIYNDDKSVKYPLRSGGQPRYPIDPNTGIENYLKGLDQSLSIAKDKDGNHVYAAKGRRHFTGTKIFYYPSDGGIGYNRFDKPIYVSDENYRVVLPKDDQNNEYYFKEKNSQTDYIYDSEGRELDRYALDNKNNQIYPVREVENGKKTMQITLLKDYAIVDNVYIYPLDEYNNEYTHEYLEHYRLDIGYPVTYDGYVILANFENNPHIWDEIQQPGVTKNDVRCLLQRIPSTDFLTDVKSPRAPRVRNGPPYVTLPLSDLILIPMNDEEETTNSPVTESENAVPETTKITEKKHNQSIVVTRQPNNVSPLVKIISGSIVLILILWLVAWLV